MRCNWIEWRSRGVVFGLAALASICVPAGTPMARNAYAQEAMAAKLALLTPEQRRTYDAWKSARVAFETEYDGYWAAVDQKRDERKRKRQSGRPFTISDYVLAQPPKYSGLGLPQSIEKLLADDTPPPPETPRPMLGDFLQAARDVYDFMPEVTTEEDFKRRYATEALAIGLTKDQVVKVYALETGGIGTYDMQAGIHPQKRTGKAISSALGYAQLLHGNSVSELVRHGEDFARRLEGLAVTEKGGPPWRPQSLRTKAAIVRAMLKDARSVPNEWNQHVHFGGTQKGLAIHALNLDADIGPWLQVIKLKGLKETAAREAGRTNLSGPEIELMNLAGPRTGLEMLAPAASQVPTTNFFSRQGYERNSVVRGRNASELLAELAKRMDDGLRQPGAIEFAAAFDAVAKR